MGWLYPWGNPTKKKLVDLIAAEMKAESRYQVLKQCVVGTNLWSVLKDNQTNRTFVALDMLAGDKDGWGYKSLAESDGPGQYDCPLAYLELLSEPTGYAAEWRDGVRRHHAQRKALTQARKSIGEGVELTYGSENFRVLRSAGPRRGWIVQPVAGGPPLRMSAKQASESTLTSATHGPAEVLQ